MREHWKELSRKMIERLLWELYFKGIHLDFVIFAKWAVFDSVKYLSKPFFIASDIITSPFSNPETDFEQISGWFGCSNVVRSSTKRFGGYFWTRFRPLAYTNPFMLTVPGIRPRCKCLNNTDVGSGSRRAARFKARKCNAIMLSSKARCWLGKLPPWRPWKAGIKKAA